MSLTVSHCCWQSLTFRPVPWSSFKSLSDFYGFWLSLNVCLCAMELLHVSHFLPWLLAASHCLSGPMEFLSFSHCLLWLLAFS